MSTGDGDISGGGAMPPHALVAVKEVDAAAGGLTGCEWWQLGDAEALSAVVALEAAERRIAAARLRLLQGIESRGSFCDTGASSAAAWLRSVTKAHPGRAHAEVRLAAGLSRYSLLQAALAEAQMSAEQVRVCVEALDALPSTLTAEKLAEAEAYLVAECAGFDPAQLRKIGKHLLHVLDPDGPALLEEAEQQAKRSRSLNVSECDGGVKLSGFLDGEGAAAVLTALDPLAAPRTGADGPDPRTPSERRADALVELARRALDAGDLPVQGKERPHVTVTLDHATLVAAAGAFGGRLDRGGPLSGEAARRICCDAKVIPVVLGGDGQPLDVGREQRTVPRHMRRAVVARDRGCAFPGCDRPPEWCEAHHVTFWGQGGDTSVDNLALLCGHHHDVIHHTPWRMRIDETTGQPVFTDPQGADHAANATRHRRIEQLADPPGDPPDE
jgi:hypothetical protein